MFCALASFEPHHGWKIWPASSSIESQPQTGRQALQEPTSQTNQTLRNHRNATPIIKQAPPRQLNVRDESKQSLTLRDRVIPSFCIQVVFRESLEVPEEVPKLLRMHD